MKIAISILSPTILELTMEHKLHNYSIIKKLKHNMKFNNHFNQITLWRQFIIMTNLKYLTPILISKLILVKSKFLYLTT